MIVKPLPGGRGRLNTVFVKAFERGMLQSGVRKKSGAHGTFKGVPAYRVVAGGPVGHMTMTVNCWAFIANGNIYALSVYSYDYVPAAQEVNEIFAAYEWLSPPVLPSRGFGAAPVVVVGVLVVLAVIGGAIVAVVLALKKS